MKGHRRVPAFRAPLEVSQHMHMQHTSNLRSDWLQPPSDSARTLKLASGLTPVSAQATNRFLKYSDDHSHPTIQSLETCRSIVRQSWRDKQRSALGGTVHAYTSLVFNAPVSIIPCQWSRWNSSLDAFLNGETRAPLFMRIIRDHARVACERLCWLT